MDAELENLRIDRSQRRSGQASPWAARWIVGGVRLFLLLGAWRLWSVKGNAPAAGDVARVQTIGAANQPDGGGVHATGCSAAAHTSEVAAKAIGKVKWIGVDKGDRVRESQILVRLEDD